MKIKKCLACKETKSIDNFSLNKVRRDGHQGYCKPCVSQKAKTHYQAYPELDLARSHARQVKKKIEVLGHYSNGIPTCTICRETRLGCLSIDHINGGGNAHRRSLKKSMGVDFYAWLRQNNYPEGYQVLCMNDQFLKRERNHELRGVTKANQ